MSSFARFPATMTTKKIGVLIGGSGLIGGTIVNFYQAHHADTVDIRAPSSKKVSLRDETDVRSYLGEVKPDFLINASMANLGASSRLAMEVNYLGPIVLARAAAALGIPYIHFSSAATLPSGENLTEEDTLALAPGLSNYAKSKLMAELTLRRMAEREGLDYSCIRLAIVYGAHDHKIQGFHRMFFSIADESMPMLFTKKNTLHSYSNARKLPFLVHHMLRHRQEFRGQTYHFVDREPVDLSTLILTIRSYLNLSLPKKLYVPYWLADSGRKIMATLLKGLRRFGLKATMPAELMFLDSFYKPQTLSTEKLRMTSFVDPFPDETIFTNLPELVVYYLTRWSQENLITTYNATIEQEPAETRLFTANPEFLLDAMHSRGLDPYPELIRENWRVP
jgi:GlcNAc-P-P-Und epimerase